MSNTEGTDGSWNIMNDLPSNYVREHYHSITKLKSVIGNVQDSLVKNNGEGNQYILVLGLPESIRKRLVDEDAPLGVGVRLELDGTSAVIKIPSAEHDVCTRGLTTAIELACLDMGVPVTDFMMAGTMTHETLGGQRAKQPDECLWPAGRDPGIGRTHGWPTLVIETGVSESLPRLEQDARWWFENSLGETRIVLVVAISRKRHRIIIEKWQLAPPGTPSPLTRLRIHQIRSLPPPRVQQAANLQQPYVAQEIDISPAGVSGAPLVLDIHAVLDRPPTGNETDIVIPANMLRRGTRSVCQ